MGSEEDGQEPREVQASSGGSEALSPSDPPESLWAPVKRRFLGLSCFRRFVVVLCGLFVVFHLSAMLIRGGPKKLRDATVPVLSWYSGGLRMTDTWGMFSKRARSQLVSVVGILKDGSRVELAHLRQNERNLKDRIVDVRLRKILSKMTEEKSRKHWGRSLVSYYCKRGLEQGLSLQRVQVEVIGKEETPEVHLRQICRAPRETATVPPGGNP